MTTPVCPHCQAPLWVDVETMLTCESDDCCHAGESWTLDEVRILRENLDEQGAQRMIERQAERYFYGDPEDASYRISMNDAGRGRLLS